MRAGSSVMARVLCTPLVWCVVECGLTHMVPAPASAHMCAASRILSAGTQVISSAFSGVNSFTYSAYSEKPSVQFSTKSWL